MQDDLAMIRQIVSENANLRLVGGEALELVEVLRFYANASDDGIGFPVPEAWMIIDDVKAFHVLRA